jgi:hypothetical protein
MWIDPAEIADTTPPAGTEEDFYQYSILYIYFIIGFDY